MIPTPRVVRSIVIVVITNECDLRGRSSSLLVSTRAVDKIDLDTVVWDATKTDGCTDSCLGSSTPCQST